MAAKAGMGDTLRAVLVSEQDRLPTRDLVRGAITTLLAAGAGRPGTDADEVLMSLGGITLIAGEEQQP
jgi:hypothetical protein